MILHCPVSGTLCLGRNHHCHTSGGHIAHSTGNIVSTKRWKLSIDIFYSTNRTTSLHSTLVPPPVPTPPPPPPPPPPLDCVTIGGERMVAFPLGKLVYLGVKQLSKPISIQLRSSAAKHPFVSKYICAPPAHCECELIIHLVASYSIVLHGISKFLLNGGVPLRFLSPLSAAQTGHLCEAATDGYEGES